MNALSRFVTRAKGGHYMWRRATTPTTPVVLLRRLLRQTGDFVDHCRYLSGAHYHYSAYQWRQSDAKTARDERKLLSTLSKLARVLPDADCRRLFVTIEAATHEVIGACEHFPRDREWPGQVPLADQQRAVASLQAHLRSASRQAASEIACLRRLMETRA